VAERFTVDLTPGPAGHLGQIIVLGVRSPGGYVLARRSRPLTKVTVGIVEP
jgi:cell wall assembly regulator SMI1